MSRALWIKRGHGLWPAGPHTEELLAGIAQGELVLTSEPKCPRNPAYHRLMMAILSKVQEHTFPRFARLEDVMDWLKLKSGMVKEIELGDGRVRVRFKSISFASMGEAEFHAVCEQWLAIIADELIPGVDPQALLDEAKAAA